MASDVAEFLWNKFLKSLAELESELSGTITISVFKSIKTRLYDFKAIRDFVNESDIMLERNNYSEIIRVFYELNDALAECRIFAHERRELDSNLSRFKPRRFSRNMKNRLTKITKELKELPSLQEEIGRHLGKKTGPKLSAQVFGFDEQSEEIENMILPKGGTSSSNAGGFRAIGVVGIAGVGKTTLVQKVLESKQVKNKFEHILWLPFSGMREGEQQYSKLSFETCIFDNSGVALEGRIVGLDKLLEKLGQLLSSGKSYLIVLDDVCRKYVNIMERLCSGLPKHNGSAVIVTTRLKQVAQKLGEQHSLVHVKPLDREICWCIFEETFKNRFPNFNFSLGVDTKKIKEIKDQCHGLPLVAKTLAENVPESALSEPIDRVVFQSIVAA